MSVKRLVLAAAVAIFGLSLAGCVDGGPYYGAYTYSDYYGPYSGPGYYGPGYYGGAVYSGYYTSYQRRHHRRYYNDRHRDSGHYGHRDRNRHSGSAYQDRNRNWRSGGDHRSSRGAVRSSYSGSNSVRQSQPSYRSGRQGSSHQNRRRGNNEQQ